MSILSEDHPIVCSMARGDAMIRQDMPHVSAFKSSPSRGWYIVDTAYRQLWYLGSDGCVAYGCRPHVCFWSTEDEAKSFLQTWRERHPVNRKSYSNIERLLYKLARHLRNPDDLPLVTWGVAGIELLAEIRELDPKRYDNEVTKS